MFHYCVPRISTELAIVNTWKEEKKRVREGLRGRKGKTEERRRQ